MSQESSPPADHGGEEGFDPTPHRPSRGRLVFTAFAALLAIGAVTAAGVLPRLKARATAREDTARSEQATARVIVVTPTRALVGAGGVTLPGSIQAVQETQIYSRTNGYVRRYQVDLGDPVTAGQVLAIIDTPEVDQELRQVQASVQLARASVQQARTQLTLARSESTRYGSLVDSGVVTQQETASRRAQADVGEANVLAAQATLASAEANLVRLRDLKSFATVRAPFDGTITARAIEVGQLVTAGSGAGQSIFRVSKTDVVRVFVNVPQLYASGVHVGAAVTVRMREFPARVFHGTIARTAGALDVATRTLPTEVRIPNADHALLAGMYTQVTLPLERATAPLSVPSTALITDADGTRMAVVEQGQIRWRAVRVDSDQGDRVSIATGLREGDEVVVTPSERLAEGLRVRTEMQARRAP